MNRKTKIILILVLIIAVILIYHNFDKTRVKSFDQVLKINSSKVTKMMIQLGNDIKVIEEKEKIQELINYMNKFGYKRKEIDEITPEESIKAYLMFLYQEDKMDFINPLKSEIMFSKGAYYVVGGVIEQSYLDEFYNSLE